MKILIVKTSALGDILHAFSVISYLKSKFQEVQIDWVVEKPFKELLEPHPEINKIICIESKQWRKNFFKKETSLAFKEVKKELQSNYYDYIFDLQGNLKSGLVTFLAKGKYKVGYGWKTVSEWPNCLFTNIKINPPNKKNIREEYLSIVQSTFKESFPIKDEIVSFRLSQEKEEEVNNILKKMPVEPLIMVCPGSAWKNKQLSETSLCDFLEKFRALYNCHFLLLWGTDLELEMAIRIKERLREKVSLLDKVSLPQLHRIMQKMKLVIAMDSLPLHLASIAGVSTFSIFGPSSKEKYQPIGVQHIALSGKCPYDITFEKRCPKLRKCSSGACIKQLDGGLLLDFLRNSKNFSF